MKSIYQQHAGLKASIEWMRSRPDSVKALMLRFPPSCSVVATRPLSVPGPDTIGQVASYFEPDEECPEGLVSVTAPDMFGIPHRGQCRVEWLKVVDYHFNSIAREFQTEDWVREVLGL